MRIILAFSMQAAMPWVLVLVSGVITLLLGLVIVAHWPVASLYVLEISLGVDLILAGAGWLAIGLGLIDFFFFFFFFFFFLKKKKKKKNLR